MTRGVTGLGRILRLGLALAVLAGIIWALAQVGRGVLALPPAVDPAMWRTWSSRTDPVVVTFAVARVLTLAVAWYLLAATLLNGVAELAANRRLMSVAEILTVPALRRALQSALGVGLTATTLVAPAPDVRSPGVPSVAAARLEPAAGTKSPTAWEVMPPVAPRTTILHDTPAPVPGLHAQPPALIGKAHTHPEHPPALTWTVQAGEHLWSIAEAVLRETWQRPPTDTETQAYWQGLVAANREALVDRGNPDLILPGQVFTLPPAPPAA
jgi:hypothetical protein